jgi:predicted sugar kinase
MVVIQQSAEARPTAHIAVGPVVIRRTDVPDELATHVLVVPLGDRVIKEFLDQVPQMALAENDKVIQTLVLVVLTNLSDHFFSGRDTLGG